MGQLESAVCQACGQALPLDGRFCTHCGVERVAATQAPDQETPPQGMAPGDLTWEIDVGLLTNPTLLRQFALVVVGAGALMALLLSFLLAVQGEWADIPMMLGISALAAGGLGLLMVLVILLFFRNRFRVRFTVGDKGVLFETADRRALAGNRLAMVLGVLGNSPTTAGAGLSAMAREDEFTGWGAITEARYHPAWRGITLRNRWRTVAFVACTPENYDQVAALVRRHVVQAAMGSAAVGPNPLPRLLGRSLLVVLAALPVFLLSYPFELDLLMPLIMLCFALATVWLIPFFGWVVIVAALWIAAEILLIGLGVRESIFAWRGSYRTYEILDGGDWFALALAAAGLAYLILFSWQAARGRIPSALMADEVEMEEP
jgi:hypothetical protein